MQLLPTLGDDPKTLVSTEWLAKHLRDADLRILDASWFLPGETRNARAEYEAGHIPGARFFDIDEISDQRSALPHMAPAPEKFISRMRTMGVGDGHQVVIYDSSGIFSAPRVWWLFRLMGKTDVAVLDGGLPKWRAEGREIVAEPAVIRDRHMTVAFQPQLVRDVTQIAQATKLGAATVVDARAAARFEGRAPEPRAGLRSGHIPRSRNIVWNSLLEADGRMKSAFDLFKVFEAAGVDLAAPVITSCGSGVTAAVLALGLERLGHRDWSLYDGSWAEWGMFDDLPIDTGPAA